MVHLFYNMPVVAHRVLAVDAKFGCHYLFLLFIPTNNNVMDCFPLTSRLHQPGHCHCDVDLTPLVLGRYEMGSAILEARGRQVRGWSLQEFFMWGRNHIISDLILSSRYLVLIEAFSAYFLVSSSPNHYFHSLAINKWTTPASSRRSSHRQTKLKASPHHCCDTDIAVTHNSSRANNFNNGQRWSMQYAGVVYIGRGVSQTATRNLQ